MQYLLIEAEEMVLLPIDVYHTEQNAHREMCKRIASVLKMPLSEVMDIYENGDEYDETYIRDDHAQTEKFGTNYAWRIIPLESSSKINLYPF